MVRKTASAPSIDGEAVGQAELRWRSIRSAINELQYKNGASVLSMKSDLDKRHLLHKDEGAVEEFVAAGYAGSGPISSLELTKMKD